MDEFIKPKIEEERQRIVDQVREEATENAIITVRSKLKDQWEAEQQQKEAGEFTYQAHAVITVDLKEFLSLNILYYFYYLIFCNTVIPRDNPHPRIIHTHG